MIRAHRRHEGASEAALRVRLGFDDRHRRRLAVTALSGERVLIDLPEATQLRGGDTLELEDGRLLAVDAADEEVADIAASDPVTLARLAWHLGNRHTPAAVLPGRLRIRRDHVLEAMAARLGGVVTTLAAPFDPEPGAYDGQGHGHGGDGHGSHRHGGPDHRDHDHHPSHRHHHGHAHDDDGHGHAHGDDEHANAAPAGLDWLAAQSPRRARGTTLADEPVTKSPVARHRVVACGDGADAAIDEPPRAGTLSNADERAPDAPV